MRKSDLLSRFTAFRSRWIADARFARAIEEIRDALARADTREHAVVLDDSGGWRSALLGLAPNAEIPLHDHPQARGLLYLLEGVVSIRRFDRVIPGDAGRFTLLAERGTAVLAAGAHDWIGRRRHNLHAIVNHQETALIFSVRQRLADQGQPSVYGLIAPASPDAPSRMVAAAFPARGRSGRE